MSYLASFPKKLRFTARTFRAISRLWYTDRVHPEPCLCGNCGPYYAVPATQLVMFDEPVDYSWDALRR